MTTWDRIDEWTADHPILGLVTIPLLPAYLLATLLIGDRRNGYPICPSMPLKHHGVMTEDERCWREIRWREIRERGRD